MKIGNFENKDTSHVNNHVNRLGNTAKHRAFLTKFRRQKKIREGGGVEMTKKRKRMGSLFLANGESQYKNIED